jgi:hypothetical protein
MTNFVGIANRPTQYLHASQAAPYNSRPFRNLHPIHQSQLATHPVADGDDRKIWAVVLVSLGIDRGGAGTAGASAEIIQANYVEEIGIYRLSWPDTAVPPAGFAIIFAMVPGRMMIAAERMTDKKGIRLFTIELAVSLND